MIVHAIFFSREVRSQLKDRVPLAAVLTTTIDNPEARDVVFRFRVGGEATFYLNGYEVEEEPVEDESELHPLFRQARRTSMVRLPAGKNR